MIFYFLPNIASGPSLLVSIRDPKNRPAALHIQSREMVLVPTKTIPELPSAINEFVSNHALHTKLTKKARSNYLDRFDLQKVVPDLIIPLYLKS